MTAELEEVAKDAKDAKDEKKLFVTWERFKPTEEDSYETGLCKTVAFLLRHVSGTNHQWVPFDGIIDKASNLWNEGIKKDIDLAKAYQQTQDHDEEEARPRFEFKTENGVRQIRALHQSERVTKPAKSSHLSQPLKVFQGKDLIGYVDPDSIKRGGRIWNAPVNENN